MQCNFFPIAIRFLLRKKAFVCRSPGGKIIFDLISRTWLTVLLLVIISGSLKAESGAKANSKEPRSYGFPSSSQDPAGDIVIKGLDFARLVVLLEVVFNDKQDVSSARQLEKLLERNLCWSGLFSIIMGSEKYCGVKDSSRADLSIKVEVKDGQFQLKVLDLGPGGQLLFESNLSLRKALKEKNIIVLVNQMARNVTGKTGILGSSIVFAMKERGENLVIAATDTHQAEPKIISRNDNIAILPRLSSDAQSLVYTEISLRGSRIYYQKLGKKGRRSGYLTDFGSLNNGGSFSSDGRLAVVISVGAGTDLFFFNLNKRKPKPQHITTRIGIEFQPDWHPANHQLVYVSFRSGAPQIYLLDLQSRRNLRLTFNNSYSADPRWSPDGEDIMFTRRVRGVDQIYVMDKLGQNIRAITQGRYNCEQSEWSPDGRQIVFSSRRSGDFKLYVASIDGSGLRRVTNTGKGIEENSPSWEAGSLF